MTRPVPYFTSETVRVLLDSPVDLDAPPSTIDGVDIDPSDKVLVTAQVDAAENGVFIYRRGKLQRPLNEVVLASGQTLMVQEGDTYKDTLWILTTDNPIVAGQTGLTYEPFVTDPDLSGVGQLVANNTWTGTNEFQDVVTLRGAASSISRVADAADDPFILSVVEGEPSFHLVVSSRGQIGWGEGDTGNSIGYLTPQSQAEGMLWQTKLKIQAPGSAERGLAIDDGNSYPGIEWIGDGTARWSDRLTPADLFQYRNGGIDGPELKTSGVYAQDGTPTQPEHLATKQYVDDNAGGVALGDTNIWTADNTFSGDSFYITGTNGLAIVPTSSDPAIYVTDAANTLNVFRLDETGKMEWSDGVSPTLDTNLYRSGSSELKTDGSLHVGTDVVVDGYIRNASLGPVNASFVVNSQVGTTVAVDVQLLDSLGNSWSNLGGILGYYVTDQTYDYNVAVAASAAVTAGGMEVSGVSGNWGPVISDSLGQFTVTVDSNGTPDDYYLVLILANGQTAIQHVAIA